MPQHQGEYQIQQQRQQTKLSPQQLAVMKLIELPIGELEQCVKNNVIENTALEEGRQDFDKEEDDYQEDGIGEEYSNDTSRNEKTDTSFDDYASLDDVPSYLYNQREETRQEMPLGDTKSFMDDLIGQISDYDLNEHQQELLKYLIGSLNDDGFIERDIPGLVTDIILYHDIETDEEELTYLLHILQQFDPAGIGARNTRECLLIQLERRNIAENPSELIEHRIIADYYDDLVNQRVESLARKLGVTVQRIHEAFENLSKLNPRPGIALCESANTVSQTIIPDFIIETSPDGTIDLSLNNGDIPELHISKEYEANLKLYQQNKGKMSRQAREAFEYTQQKVEKARFFIDSIRQRHNTLLSTMKAIIDYQREFILSQDESALVPMRLEDIAQRVGLDTSTISRVRKSKYAVVDGNIYPLDIFFKHARTNADGEIIEHSEVTDALRRLIDSEDKSNPLTDMQLSEKLKTAGFNISRRTIAKYRLGMGIPSTKDRRDV